MDLLEQLLGGVQPIVLPFEAEPVRERRKRRAKLDELIGHAEEFVEEAPDPDYATWHGFSLAPRSDVLLAYLLEVGGQIGETVLAPRPERDIEAICVTCQHVISPVWRAWTDEHGVERAERNMPVVHFSAANQHVRETLNHCVIVREVESGKLIYMSQIDRLAHTSDVSSIYSDRGGMRKPARLKLTRHDKYMTRPENRDAAQKAAEAALRDEAETRNEILAGLLA
jgi:hypothetical protein